MVPSSCCGDFNEKAVLFRQSINSSLSTGKLQAELVTKTITEGFGIRVKADVDTDGKKREFTGDSRPGVESNEFGYRWETGGKWEPGSRLVLSPPFQSREGMGTEPNFGWLPPEDKSTTTFEEMLRAYREKPKIKLSKYKVNPRTDEVIPDSEKIIDPFGMAAGLTYEEKQQALRKNEKNTLEEKRLPGRSLESRVPGGSLLSRAAAVFGILRDENNKFRCPPGTPAANQFTDATGANCFGFSASKFSRFAARKAAELTAQGEYTGLRQNAADFFRWIHGPRSMRDPAIAEKCAYWGVKIPEWRNIAVPENLRLFKNGAIRGQDDIARQKAEVVRMYDALGIDADDPDAPVKALKKLKEMHSQTGGTAGWDVQVLDVSGKGDELLTDVEIKEFVKTRLSSTPGWNRLSSKEQERLLKSDFERYKTTQRAMLETLLDQFMTDPGSMRGVGRIEFNFMTDDEAGTSFYRTQNGMKTAIHINMGMISANQETMLPNMGGDERLAISAIGARSEAEGRLAVADFMVNADHTARGMAGLLDGVYGFSSHIMLHEIAHHKQSQVFLDKIQKEITEKGFISVAVRNKKGAVVGEREVKNINSLTGSDLMSIMTGIADSINIESLNDAMTRIQAIAPLAGAYPRDGYAVGSEVWALEASAEIWALRERGIIFGDDVDAALEWMDNMSFSVAARDRTASDDTDGQRKLDDVFDIPADPVDPGSVSDEDIDARATAAIREEIKRFKTEFSKFSEDEMFEEAAIIGSQRDVSARQVESLEAIEIDPSLPEDERDARELLKAQAVKDAKREFDFHTKRYDEASKIWRKKFGIGASGEKKRFEDEVYSIRKREGLLDSKEMADIARRADLDDLRDRVKSMPEKKTISLLVDDKVKLSKLDPSSEEFKKLADEIEVIREQYVENMKAAGDTRTKAQIKKDLDKKVNDTINPPSKPKKKFKSADEARKHGAKERARVKATPEQKKAMKELGDVAESDVGMLLDPVSQTRAGRAINKRNARLKKLGLKVDKTSSEEGDVVQQVENLLIPTMEAIDGTSVGEPFEMEAIIDFKPGDVGYQRSQGKEVSLDQFISGRVITSRTKKTEMPARGKRDPKSGTTKRRVILSVREKDRGLFPTTGGDSEQKFVAPPGRIRITNIDNDGTIRAEISYQKDTVEVVDSLAENLSKNTTDAIWARSHGKKIQAMADKYVTKRRSSGKAGPGPRSDSDESASTKSKATLDKVTDAGGSFADYDDAPAGPSLSSGATRPDGVLGKPSTRQQRTESRTAASSSIIRNIKDVLGGGGKDGTISRGDIHPEVAKFIADTPEEEIIAKAAETAYRMHEGFDRRVRVRATDSDIDKLASGAGVRSPFSGSSADSSRPTRRAQRLAQMGPEERSERLSSGRTIDTSGNLAERRRQEGDIAKKALDVFNDVIDSGTNINDMSDDEISKKFGGVVKRSARSSISEKDSNLYEVDDVHTAVAMMMLGHHVEVKEQDIRLTEQAQKVFEKEVKKVAKNHIKDNHPKWRSFQEDYAKRNPDADLDDPETRKSMEGEYVGNYQADLCSLYNPANNLMCSGHIGIDREKMPQTNGRSSGHKTKAIRALKNGVAAGKWEPLKDANDNSLVSRDRGLEIEFADELDKAVKKQNAKRAEQGKPPVSDEEISGILYGIIADKHSLKNEMGGKTAAEHREDSFSKLSDRAKEWLYENTNWNDTEVNLETPFIDWLNGLIKVSDPENGPAVRRRDVDPSEYAPSQQQIVASKADGTAQTIQEKAIEVAEKIRKDNPKISDKDFRDKYLEEMKKEWFMQPILTTKDSYILDGHHRWAGIVVGNRSLSEELQLPLSANEVQTDIIEGLTLGKVFQDAFGIKEARLGAENPWEVGEIEDMSAAEFADIAKDLTDNAPSLIDAKYEQGDYIQLGSVGLTNNPDYAARSKERQATAARDETRKIASDVVGKIRARGKPLHEYTPEELKEDFGDSIKPSDLKPLFTSSDPKDMAVYKVDNVGQAIALMALGHHVSLEYSSDEAIAKKQKESLNFAKTLQEEFFKDIKKMGEDVIANNEKEWLDFKEKEEKTIIKNGGDPAALQEVIKKNFLNKFTDKYKTNLCNFYDGDENVFCGNNLGIPRAKMPQAGGRLVGANTRGAELGLAGEIPLKKVTHKHMDPYGIKKWEGEDRFQEIMARVKKGPESASAISDEDRQFVMDNLNWDVTEIDGTGMIKEIIRGKLGDDAIKENIPVDPSEYTPSQQELDAVQTDGMHESLKAAVEHYTKTLTEGGKYKRGTKEFTDALVQALKDDDDTAAKASGRQFGAQGMMDPILATSDKYLLDGHHRWSAITVYNGEVDDDQKVPLHVDEVQTDIVSGLTLTKVLQRGLGLKDAKLTGAVDFEEGDIKKVEIGERARVLKEINDSMDSLAADIYAEGDFIEIDSVGMRNNPQYAEEILMRQQDALSRPAKRTANASQSADSPDADTADTLSSGRTSVGNRARLRSSTGGVGVSSSRESEVEPGSTVGLSSENYAREYYSRIGIPDSVDGDLLPVSGYLVHKSHMDKKKQDVTKGRSGNLRPDAVFEIGDEDVVGDGLTALGDIEIVLRPGVSERTAYGRGNSISSAHRPVRLNSRNREDVADALLNSDGVSADSNRQDAFINMISASLNNDFSNVNATRGKNGKMPNSFESKLPEGSSREPFEAQILGGFDISDVEQINIPFKRLEAASAKEDIGDVVNTKTIADRLRSAGFSPEEIEYFYSIGGGQLNTESMAMLRNYRASQKMKTDLAGRGFNNVKFAHPTGFNIEDPRSHSKSPIGGDSAEATLIRAISDEIIKAAKELLDDMRKTNKPTLTTTAGSLM
jgi:hypothetical protein